MSRKLSTIQHLATFKQRPSKVNRAQPQQNMDIKSPIGKMNDSAVIPVEQQNDLFDLQKLCYQKKLTIVGPTEASYDLASKCLNQKLCTEICIFDNYDTNCERSLDNPDIKTTKNIADTRKSDLIIISTDLMAKKYFADNSQQHVLNIMLNVIPQLLRYSRYCLLFIDTQENAIILELEHKLSLKNMLHPNHKFIRDVICRKYGNRIIDKYTMTADILRNFSSIKGLTMLETPEVFDFSKSKQQQRQQRQQDGPIGTSKLQNKEFKFKKIIV